MLTENSTDLHFFRTERLHAAPAMDAEHHNQLVILVNLRGADVAATAGNQKVLVERIVITFRKAAPTRGDRRPLAE